MKVDPQVVAAGLNTPLGLVVGLVILMGLVVVLLAIVAWFFKDMRHTINKSVEDNAKEIDRTTEYYRGEIKRIWEHLGVTERQLPMTYVLRDDFIRMMTQFDKKLDQVIDSINGFPCRNGGTGGCPEATDS